MPPLVPSPRTFADALAGQEAGCGYPRRHLRVAVSRLARRVLSGRRPAAPLAGVLRRPVRHGGEQRDLLPPCRAGYVRGVAGTAAGRIRHGGQGQSLSHAHSPPERPRRASAPPHGRRDRPGGAARACPAAASADHDGRTRSARRVPSSVPVRHPDSRGAPAFILVDRPHPPGADRSRCRAVLGGSSRRAAGTAVAHH